MTVFSNFGKYGIVGAGGGPAIFLTNCYMIAGGGGGGGYGGGGAGGYRELVDQEFINGNSYSVTIGAGGTQGTPMPSPSIAAQGIATSIIGTNINIASSGGGGGGQEGPGPNALLGGQPGGSGGGGGAVNPGSPNRIGGTGNKGGYSPVEGYAGGNGSQVGPLPSFDPYCGGGGGGAGGVGESSPGAPAPAGRVAGDGGAGINPPIFGPVGGGGGGGIFSTGLAGAAGPHGGGAGGSYYGTHGNPGTSPQRQGDNAPGANRGGGGGAGGWYLNPRGSGSSGKVIIRYLTAQGTKSGGSVSTAGSYTIHTFTSSGTFST